MSERASQHFRPPRIALVGATGLIGGKVIQTAVGREDFTLFAVARREAPLPHGARMEMFVADPGHWGEMFASQQPDALICALGTTWRKAGKEEVAFRKVDERLVVETARAAHQAGVKRMVMVSAAGADAHSKNFYLRVKGETETHLAKIGFARLDMLRPGLLRGHRGGDRRMLERLGIAASPLFDLVLHGKNRRYRSVDARRVAEAALAFCMRKAAGRFVHEHDAILRAARELPMPHFTQEQERV